MKLYQYLLFRIYCLFRDTIKDKENIFASVTIVSTLIIWFLFFIPYTFLDYVYTFPIYSNFKVLVSGVILALLNYYLFIKDKKFLERGFKKDKKGGVIIIVFILSILFTFIGVSNMNRAKISKKIEDSGVHNKQLNKNSSLERRIRDWFDETF